MYLTAKQEKEKRGTLSVYLVIIVSYILVFGYSVWEIYMRIPFWLGLMGTIDGLLAGGIVVHFILKTKVSYPFEGNSAGLFMREIEEYDEDEEDYNNDLNEKTYPA